MVGGPVTKQAVRLRIVPRKGWSVEVVPFVRTMASRMTGSSAVRGQAGRQARTSRPAFHDFAAPVDELDWTGEVTRIDPDGGQTLLGGWVLGSQMGWYRPGGNLITPNIGLDG